MLKGIQTVNRVLMQGLKVLTIFAMVALNLLVIFQVFNRLFFHIQAVWTEEMARFSMVWLAMLGGAVAIQTGEHITVNMLFQLLPGKPTEFIRLVGLLFRELLFVALFVSSFLWVKGTAAVLTQATRIPTIYIYIVFPVSALMMFLFGLEDILECAQGLFRKKAPGKEAE